MQTRKHKNDLRFKVLNAVLGLSWTNRTRELKLGAAFLIRL